MLRNLGFVPPVVEKANVLLDDDVDFRHVVTTASCNDRNIADCSWTALSML